MGPGFKYHIVTITAIFLALTVGLVIGSLYVSPQLADKQGKEIRKLQSSLQLSLSQQKRQLQHYGEFIEQTRPTLLKNKLNGTKVAIIQTGDYPDVVSKVKEALQSAGALVVSETSIESAYQQSDEMMKKNLEALHTEDIRIPTDRQSLARLVAEILTGKYLASDDILKTLVDARFLRTTKESNYQIPVRYFVFVVGSRTDYPVRVEQIDKPLIDALHDQKAIVVACEPLESAFSDIPIYNEQNLEVATVDNVDTDLGACALVFALKGDKKHYGVKETAKQLLPSMVTP